MAELPPPFYFVPIHCIPQVLTLKQDDGSIHAFAAPAAVIKAGRWFRGRSSDDSAAMAPFYDEPIDDTRFLAVRSVTGMQSDEPLDFNDSVLFIHNNTDFPLFRSRQKEKLAYISDALLQQHGLQCKVLDFFPSPNNQSGWLHVEITTTHPRRY